MDYKVFKLLAKILSKEGLEICSSQDKLETELKNVTSEDIVSIGQIKLVLLVLEERIPQALSNIIKITSDHIGVAESEHLAKYCMEKKLHETFSIDKAAAEWVVRGWWKTLWELSGGYFCPVTGMEFSPIKGGTFQMGDIWGDSESNPKLNAHNRFSEQLGIDKVMSNELPVHKVEINDFFIGRYPVTQREWEQIIGRNPSFLRCDDMPVEKVSMTDCREYVFKLNKACKMNYRLPTEAEWEYAARSRGNNEKFSGSNKALDVACFKNVNSCHMPVGSKKPNGVACYDMSGNVWEFCSDYYQSDYYMSSPTTNPKGPLVGDKHVVRGGCWLDTEFDIRCARRKESFEGESHLQMFTRGVFPLYEENRFAQVGLRLAFTPKNVGENVFLPYVLGSFHVSENHVHDRVNNLLWMRDLNAYGFPMSRNEAMMYVANLGCGWRLPSIAEFNMLSNAATLKDQNRIFEKLGFIGGGCNRKYWARDTEKYRDDIDELCRKFYYWEPNCFVSDGYDDDSKYFLLPINDTTG